MVKWSDTSDNVLRQLKIVQNSAYISNKFIKNNKKRNFLALPIWEISCIRSQIFLEFSKTS
jgi:hypothetical protein